MAVNGHRDLYGVMKMFQYWIVVMVSQLCKFTKNYWTIQLIWVDFMLSKLYSRQFLQCDCGVWCMYTHVWEWWSEFLRAWALVLDLYLISCLSFIKLASQICFFTFKLKGQDYLIPKVSSCSSNIICICVFSCDLWFMGQVTKDYMLGFRESLCPLPG